MDTKWHCSNCDTEIPAEAEGDFCAKCGTVDNPPLSNIPPLSHDSSSRGRDTSTAGRIHYFGDYELKEKLGQGCMGEVWRARQVSLNRPVAVKMILAGLLATDEQVKRFLQEAETAASLDHLNIVPIYEVSEDKGRHYFSMKLVEGRPLTAVMPELRADFRKAARLLVIVARAVHHAHQRGILHRDIKPGNILIDEQGQPHVTDFGLAKRIEGVEDLTVTGGVVGTPSYMSPEQASGKVKQLTTAVDVYSLGALLYQILTGYPPFKAETLQATLRQVEEQEPKRPSTIAARVDRDLETICLKCLEKEPGKRYGSAEAFAEDLERWLNHKPILARPTGTLERAVKWVRRNRVTFGMTMTVAAVLVVGAALNTWQWQSTQSAHRDAQNMSLLAANAGKAHLVQSMRLQLAVVEREIWARTTTSSNASTSELKTAEESFEAGLSRVTNGLPWPPAAALHTELASGEFDKNKEAKSAFLAQRSEQNRCNLYQLEIVPPLLRTDRTLEQLRELYIQSATDKN